MPRDDKSYLLDMLVAARDAMAYAENVSYGDFERNREKQRAIFNAVQEIGEAASRISPEFKSAHPSIAWPDIVGMRNRLVHAYFDIDLRLVWDTLRNDLPDLTARLEALAPEMDE
ncbi:MAG: DUF86 domain-containing protein [Rhodospirillaceae bacterium]|nr:DUF86 domain-containing protein [Rhodospirillaceae bacterium]MYF87109.1 DUF86 domain-containing protein [Rhodospirillaceae bacterium]MYH35823.1 DUF86 domain-containing protein [Rhodospirillaceae bacterium]MYK15899.1 DUF86 domain-containing protein [Rhodospirillaceae bacterium]MYK60152.1 DUF86 domain-containing protein [Rhodospirillaceae bacterium]